MQSPWFPDLSTDDHAPDAWLGGELSLQWVLAAYPRGFFPWPVDGEPLAWWCPRLRMVFEPDGLHASRSLRRTIRSGRFEVRFDRAFERVVARCRDKRGPGRDGTWITPEIVEVYTELHRMGLAHSAETWLDGEVVGGIYGLSLGGTFFGESMFADERDASKVAIAGLTAQLDAWGMDMLDCQVPNDHLISLGGSFVPRRAFIARLGQSLARPTRRGPWTFDQAAFRARYGGA